MSDSGYSGKTLGQSDVQRMLSEHVSAASKLSEDDRKFLGMTLSPTMYAAVQTGWGIGGVLASDYLNNKSYKFYHDYVGQSLLKMETSPALVRNAKVAAIGTVIGLAALPFIGDVFKALGKQKKEKENISKKIAPVLDEIKGARGIVAFNGVNRETNEVLYSHRHRMHKEADYEIQNSILMALIKVSPVAFKTITGYKNIGAEKDVAHAGVAASHGDNVLNKLGVSGTAAGFIGMFSDPLKADNKRDFESKRQPYSALEMILALEEQVQNIDPKSRASSDSFTLPGGKKSLPLTEYVAEIFRQHQRDMEGINHEYSQLRGALDPQLKEIAGLIADGIRKGDVPTISLIRLAGEGAVIKNRGRALAKPSDVQVLIEKISGKTANYAEVDPKEFFQDASFNKRDVKEALDALQGDDRLVYASMLPDSILKEAGLSQDEVNGIRDASMKMYETRLANVVVGLSSQPDEQLKSLGLADEEIKQLRDVVAHVKQEGVKGVHDYRSKPTNPVGIERVVTNAVTSHLRADREYLGKMLVQGEHAISNPQTIQGAEATGAAEVHASKLDKSHGSRADADRKTGSDKHADKVKAHREDGHDHGSKAMA